MSLIKTDNDFAAHLLSLEMAKVMQWFRSGYKHVLHQLTLDKLQTSNSPESTLELDGRTASNISVLLWMEKIVQHRREANEYMCDQTCVLVAVVE